jgi:hypothetical protein
MTRDEFIKRFCDAHPYSPEYVEGIVAPIAASVYDAVYEMIDGCVMPPTDAWLEQLIEKMEEGR